MITDFKLANVILKIDDHAAAHPELYYRAPAGTASFDEDSRALRITAETDFLTYVNAYSAIKWRRYTGIDSVHLRIVVSGRGRLVTTGVASGEEEPSAIEERAFSSHAPTVLDIDVPTAGLDLAGFTVIPYEHAALTIHRAYWYARVDEADVNRVGLALATTSFKKEDYIIPNIALVKKGIAAEGEPMASRFHMFVVDNGRTLDARALSDGAVTVIPNPNVGGAGGFARGMIAALDAGDRFTHVLLMDDDVRVMPESLVRTFSLLSLARGPYRDAFVNGAMLSLEQPQRMFEDVGYVTETSVYARVKDEDLYVDELHDVLANERTSVEVPNAYGAWWFSCIPLKAVRANGLPMPFFVRCDDVEFGMRNKPTYMTMDGICVWHASFEGRWRASVDCYQYTRNFLAMIAVDDCSSEEHFMLRLQRGIRANLRDLDYTNCELMLDGLEDYLKGPDFLAHADGAAIMAENGARNEKLVPVGELDPELLAAAGVTPEVLASVTFKIKPSSRLVNLWRRIPYDKNYLPAFMLDHRPSHIVKQGSETIAGRSFRRDTLVFLDPTRTMGCIRHVDRVRFRAIRRRERQLVHKWRLEGADVRRAWKKALPRLTSRAFWEEYLGMDKDAGDGDAGDKA